MWEIAHNFLTVIFRRWSKSKQFITYVCLAVPVYLLIFSVASTIFVGLSSMFVTDDDREWLARFGAWLSIVCVGHGSC
jgi:hypothetical protein